MALIEHDPLLRSELVGSDGYVRRVDVERVGTGLAEPEVLRAYSCETTWSVEGGGQSAGACLSPIMPATCRFVVQDPGRGAVAAIANSADLEVRARVTVDVDGDGSFSFVEFVGPLLAEASEFQPFEQAEGGSAISLTFTDGFGLLASRPFVNPSGVETFGLLRALKSLLFPLLGAEYDDGDDLWTFPAGSLRGLLVSTNWYPYLPAGTTQIPGTRDPLDAVLGHYRSFSSAEGVGVDQLTVLRGILARFNARLLQSGGQLQVVQRELLARDATAVPTWGYVPDGDGVEEETGKYTRDLSMAVRPQDATGWNYVGGDGPVQGLAVAVGGVSSEYAYEPNRINLVVNGGFEEAGLDTGVYSGDSENARYWHFNRFGLSSSSVRRVPISSGEFDILPSSVEDLYGLAINFRLSPSTPLSAVQDRWARVIGSADARYTLRFAQVYAYNGIVPSAGSSPGGVKLQLVTAGGNPVYVLKRGVAIVRAGQVEGKNVRIFMEPVLDGVTGAVNGSEVVPAGSALVLYRVDDPVGSVEPGLVGTFTLNRPLRVGDNAVYGDLEVTNPTYDDKTLDEGDAHGAFPTDELRFYYWQPYSAGLTADYVRVEAGPPTGGWVEFFTGQAGVGGVASNGAIVSGYVRLTLEGALLASGTTVNQYTVFNGIEFAAEEGGGADGDVTYTASLPAGTPGQTVALPIVGGSHPLGDGPTPDALTQTSYYNGVDVALFSTLRGNGQLTYWQHGAHTGTPQSERTIDALTALTALQQIGGLPERWGTPVGGAIRQSPGAGLPPLQPLRAYTVTQASALMDAASAADTVVHLPYPPEVGTTLYIDGCTSVQENRTVLSVTPVSAPGVGYNVTLSSGLTYAHARNRPVVYSLRVLFDTFTSDAASGSYVASGQRLTFRNTVGITNQTSKGGGTGVSFAGDPVRGEDEPGDFDLLTESLESITTDGDDPLTTI